MRKRKKRSIYGSDKARDCAREILKTYQLQVLYDDRCLMESALRIAYLQGREDAFKEVEKIVA